MTIKSMQKIKDIGKGLFGRSSYHEFYHRDTRKKIVNEIQNILNQNDRSIILKLK